MFDLSPTFSERVLHEGMDWPTPCSHSYKRAVLNGFLVGLLICAVVVMHVLGGGTRLVFGIPAFAIAGLAAVLGAVLPGRFRMPARPWCIFVVVVMAVYVLTRAACSPVEYLARFHVYFTLGALAVYLLVATRLTDQQMRLWIVAGLLVLCLPHLYYGAIQFTTWSRTVHVPGIIPPNYEWRASGMLMCPTHLGNFMAMMTMLSGAITLWGRVGWTSRILFAYMTLACLGGVVIAGSRGPYLAIACGSILFAFLSIASVKAVHRGKALLLSIGVLSLVAGVLGAAVYYIQSKPEMSRRLMNVFELKNMRFEMWEAALVPWLDKPWFGTGSWSFLYYGRMFRPIGGYQKDPIHVHNDYVQTLAEYGIVGFLLLVLVIVLHAGSGWDTIKWLLRKRLEPSMRRTSNTLALMIGGLSALGVFAAHAVVDFNMHIPANLLVIAVILAILANPAAGESQRESGKHSVFAWTARTGLLALGATLLTLAMLHMPAEYHAERARVALRDGRWAEAATHARAGLAARNDIPDLHHYLGVARLQQGSAVAETSPALARAFYEEAVKYFEAGLALFPYDVWNYLYYAQALDFVGRPVAARAAYRRAIELDPNSGQPYEMLGLHYELLGQDQLAASLYQKAIEAGPGGSQFAAQRLRQLKAR